MIIKPLGIIVIYYVHHHIHIIKPYAANKDAHALEVRVSRNASRHFESGERSVAW